MAASRSFPLLVEGSWGPDPPKNLGTKLQMYFQSRKRSGGGECEVRQEPGSPPRFLVLFFPDDGEGRTGAGCAGSHPARSSGKTSGRGRRGSIRSDLAAPAWVVAWIAEWPRSAPGR